MASFRAEARAASLLDHANITVVHDFGEDPTASSTSSWSSSKERTSRRCSTRAGASNRAAPSRSCSSLRRPDRRARARHRPPRREARQHHARPRHDDDGGAIELAKVCDFGIAALESAPDAAGDEITAGTPEYMAPEQAAGRADARTDVYACGVVLYEMLVGRPPFVAETPVGTLAKHANVAPTPPSELVDGVPPGLEAVILRALEKTRRAVTRPCASSGRI